MEPEMTILECIGQVVVFWAVCLGGWVTVKVIERHGKRNGIRHGKRNGIRHRIRNENRNGIRYRIRNGIRNVEGRRAA